MRREVILLCIVVEVLGSIGKVEPRHASLRAFARKIQLAEVLGQARTDRAEDPIEVAIAFDAGTFV